MDRIGRVLLLLHIMVALDQWELANLLYSSVTKGQPVLLSWHTLNIHAHKWVPLPPFLKKKRSRIIRLSNRYVSGVLLPLLISCSAVYLEKEKYIWDGRKETIEFQKYYSSGCSEHRLIYSYWIFRYYGLQHTVDAIWHLIHSSSGSFDSFCVHFSLCSSSFY